MKKKNGFTLVELLAVIVILAIIMIIAIPSVLGTLETSRRKSFLEYVTKIYSTAQTKWVQDTSLSAGFYKGPGLYVYNIKKDLGLSSTGSYAGYVLVYAEGTDSKDFYIYVWDDNYYIGISTEQEGLPVNYDDLVTSSHAVHDFNIVGQPYIHNKSEVEAVFGYGVTLDMFNNDYLVCFVNHYWHASSEDQDGNRTPIYFADGTQKEREAKYFTDPAKQVESLRSCIANVS